MPRAARGSLPGPNSSAHIVHHAIGPARRQDAARRGAHRAPGPDGLSLDRSRHARGRKRRTPPAFNAGSGRTVDHAFWLDAGPRDRNLACGIAGTSPQGLFRSDGRRRDVGRASTDSTSIRNARPWCGGDQDGTPDGPKLHSILDRSARPEAHVHRRCRAAACSSRSTRGADWKPLNKGVRARLSCPSPIPSSATIRIACACIDTIRTGSISRTTAGIYRLDRPADALGRTSARAMPKVGRIDRLPDGAASARSGYAVGVSDGRDRTYGRAFRRAASRRAYRSVNGGKTLAAAGDGTARRRRRGGRSSGEAMTADARPTSGRLLRHDERRGLWAVATRAGRWKMPGRSTCRTSTRSRPSELRAFRPAAS